MTAGLNIVLTGATGGIGRAFASALVPRAGSLLLAARDDGRLQAMAAGLRREHPGMEAIASSPAPSLIKRG